MLKSGFDVEDEAELYRREHKLTEEDFHIEGGYDDEEDTAPIWFAVSTNIIYKPNWQTLVVNFYDRCLKTGEQQ